MITSLALTSLMMYSTMITGYDAYQGIDMTDEEFNQFVDVHYDMFDTVSTFVGDNRGAFETGAIGGLTAAAVKLALSSSHPVTNLIVVNGAGEVAKNLYRTAVYGKVAKEERIDELERQLVAVVKEINTLKNSGKYVAPQYVSAGDFSMGHADNPNDGSSDIRSSVYSIGDHTYTTDPKETGPHRTGYREHRDPNTKEIRDIVDRIYRDSMNPRDNYVTKSDDSDD